MTNLKNILLYAGQEKEVYSRLRDEIDESNRKQLCTFSLVSCVGMVIMTFCSFFAASLVKNRSTYIASAVLSAVLFLLATGSVRKHKEIVYAGIYLFIGILFAFGINLGTFVEPNEVTVSFAILLFAIPLLFTDRPICMSICILTGIIAYFICAKITQDPIIFGYNASNVIPYGILSMLVSSYMMCVKVDRFALVIENKFLSESDQLTGLLNRRSYESHLHKLRENPIDTRLKFVAMYLNGLKEVNDRLGHRAGDELLCGAANCIQDVFLRYGHCYRIGGDEFMAILEEPSPDGDELRNELDEHCRSWKGTTVSGLSISSGISSASGGDNVDELIQLADERMYARKASYYKANGIDRRKS